MKYLRILLLVVLFALPIYSQPYLRPVAVQRVALTAVQVKEFMSHSRSIAEWRANTEKIRRMNGGKLPSFWDEEIAGDFFLRLRASWNTTLRD